MPLYSETGRAPLRNKGETILTLVVNVKSDKFDCKLQDIDQTSDELFEHILGVDLEEDSNISIEAMQRLDGIFEGLKNPLDEVNGEKYSFLRVSAISRQV